MLSLHMPKDIRSMLHRAIAPHAQGQAGKVVFIWIASHIERYARKKMDLSLFRTFLSKPIDVDTLVRYFDLRLEANPFLRAPVLLFPSVSQAVKTGSLHPVLHAAAKTVVAIGIGTALMVGAGKELTAAQANKDTAPLSGWPYAGLDAHRNTGVPTPSAAPDGQAVLLNAAAPALPPRDKQFYHRYYGTKAKRRAALG